MSEWNFNQESESKMAEDADDLQQSMHCISLLHLNCFNTHDHNHAHPPCTVCGCCGPSFPSQTPALPPSNDLHINPLKRRSPESSTSVVTTTAVTDSPEPISKKLFQDKRQRLKRMKEGLKEMKMWWEELLNEAEEATAADENSHILVSPVDSVAEFEEVVTVERTGEYLLINF